MKSHELPHNPQDGKGARLDRLLKSFDDNPKLQARIKQYGEKIVDPTQALQPIERRVEIPEFEDIKKQKKGSPRKQFRVTPTHASRTAEAMERAEDKRGS